MAPEGRAQEPVAYRVSLAGPIELGSAEVVSRALDAAARGSGAAVVLEIAAPSGRFDAAQLIASAVEASDVPVYAMVATQAWGPAALVSLAADSIFMKGESSLGAGPTLARELDEVSAPARRAIREAFASQMERRGLDRRLGEAMIDESIAIPGLVAAGELLTLSVEQGLRAGVAIAEVGGIDDLLTRLGLADADTVTVGRAWIGTTVQVTNNNWGDVRVFIVRSGTRFRLGTVTSMNSQEYQIPGDVLVPGAVVHVLAEVIGSRDRVATDNIRIESGLVIQWRLENVLSQSSYFHFVRR